MSPRRPPAPGSPASKAAAPKGPAAKSTAAKASTAGAGRSRPSARPGAGPGGPGGSRGPRAGSAGRSVAQRAGIGAGSGRPVWLIGAVSVLLVALILPYFQKWLVQRSQIEAARASVTQSQADVKQLNEQLLQWKDDQYVKAQARERLHFVMPGEIGYVVSQPRHAATPSTPDQQAAKVPAGNRPWYSDIWLSAQVAGAGTAP